MSKNHVEVVFYCWPYKLMNSCEFGDNTEGYCQHAIEADRGNFLCTSVPAQVAYCQQFVLRSQSTEKV